MNDIKDASSNEEIKSVKGQLNSIPVYNKNRMNIPLKNESRLTFQRSKVITKGDKMPLLNRDERIRNLRQSLMPVMQQNCEESRQNQMHIEINHKSKNNNYRSKIDLHSSREKNTKYSPLLTCRSAQNLGQKTLKENPYFLQNQTTLEENRSVKFIAKIRQQISSNENTNKCSKVTKKPESVQATAGNQNEKNKALVLALTERNKELQRELQDSNITESKEVKLQDQNVSKNIDQSLQRQTFEQKLIIKCKDLEYELQIKQEQLLKLSNIVKDLQFKHISELKALKDEYYFENSRRDLQIQNLRNQLIELQSNKRTIQRKRLNKQKLYQQEISRYVKKLGESEQQKNKMILQFGDVLKQRLYAIQKSCCDRFHTQLQRAQQQNLMLKARIQDLLVKCSQMEQQKSNMIQQGNFFNIQLSNYIKWNEELLQRNLRIQRQMNELSRINKELNEKVNDMEELQRRGGEQLAMIQTLSQQIQIVKLENHSLRNQIDATQKSREKIKLFYIRNIQKLRIQTETRLRELSMALSESRLQTCTLKEMFSTKQKQLQHVTERIETIQKQNQILIDGKQVQIQRQRQQVSMLQAKIQLLQIQVEEWKFICQSNALNTTLILQSKQATKFNNNVDQNAKILFQ